MARDTIKTYCHATSLSKSNQNTYELISHFESTIIRINYKRYG